MTYDPMDAHLEERLEEELFERQKKEAETSLKKLVKFKDATYYDNFYKRLAQLEQQYDAGEISKVDFECGLVTAESDVLAKRMFAIIDKKTKE